VQSLIIIFNLVDMGSEKFCLRWNDFENNIGCAFRELRDDKDFFDITLACDEDQIQAHKVIVSACSPFFKHILKRNHHQHPLLYLKGVRFTDLQSVLNFMYHGEVNVAQDELNSFLAVAEDLQVKGLTQNQSQEQKSIKDSTKNILNSSIDRYQPPEYVATSQPQQPQRHLQPSASSYSPKYQTEHYADVQEIIPVKPEPIESLPPPAQSTSLPQHHDYIPTGHEAQALTPADDQMVGYQENYEDYGQYEGEYIGDGAVGANKDVLSQLDAQISSMMYKGDKAWHCGVCDRTSRGKINISRHIEATHLENHPGINCEICGETVRTRNALRQHRADRHRGQEFKILGS